MAAAVEATPSDVAAVDAAIERAATVLARASRVVVMSGAGMSAESGIVTFRDPEVGVWKNKLLLALFGTPFGWRWLPGTAWSQYRRFRDPIAAAHPNAGHVAVARMSAALHLNAADAVQIVTQNVDALHQRAGSPPESVHEVHGSVMRYRCIRNGHRNDAVPAAEQEFPAESPHCITCGSLLRPDAVLFGEELPEGAWTQSVAAMRRLERGDVLFIIGTSGVVQPAASLPDYTRDGVFRVEINPQPSTHTASVDCYVPTGSATALPRILDRAVQLKDIASRVAPSETSAQQ